MLDTHREVVTPEGVALHLPAAGPVPRALAWVLDFVIRMAVVTLGAIVLAAMGRAGSGIHAVLIFLVYWFYPVLFEALGNGRTPGKRVLGLRVVAANGAPVGWMAAFVRNLLRTVDMLPFGYAVGLVTSLADPWGRRLGDMVAGTLVVHVERAHPPLPGTTTGSQASPVPLLPHEQAALVAFAERGPRLTAARQVELAELAAPLVDSTGTLAVHRLYAIANWLLGRR
ncbi:RDD family protein [Montanilutibacter psychrotolerans]|uniref:RDD family protein n=1 Tax=Montanilutibacter psychrotolerans TaxID=1327343 RepID=A0A3M8SSP6_9GAMM|nr:RDD family protein [Lysobacter psychrotolerans]RNF83813.1 RDD family protein [Lysobacter psychrotolerans]